MSETTKPQTSNAATNSKAETALEKPKAFPKHTYEVLKKFNHKGVWVDPKNEDVKKNGLQLTEAQARFAVLNGILKRRSDSNAVTNGDPKSDNPSDQNTGDKDDAGDPKADGSSDPKADGASNQDADTADDPKTKTASAKGSASTKSGAPSSKTPKSRS